MCVCVYVCVYVCVCVCVCVCVLHTYVCMYVIHTIWRITYIHTYVIRVCVCVYNMAHAEHSSHSQRAIWHTHHITSIQVRVIPLATPLSSSLPLSLCSLISLLTLSSSSSPPLSLSLSHTLTYEGGARENVP
jgi:hypothetical protein